MKRSPIGTIYALLFFLASVIFGGTVCGGEEYPCGMATIETEVLSPEETEELCGRRIPYHSLQVNEQGFPVNDIYYSQLSDKERILYDRICTEYERLYRSSEDLEKQRFVMIEYDGDTMSRADLRKVYYVFYYTNPQYFFAYNGFSVGEKDGKPVIALKVYEGFMDGAERCMVRDGIEDIAEEWSREINAQPTDYEKEMLIAKKLCDRIVYKTGSKYDQSLAGALYYGECVCNGYAMAVNYLCGLAGLDSFAVVSRNHAWNAVELYGRYYMLDVTWQDSSGNFSLWANKSYDAFRSQDKSGSHVIDMSGFGGMSVPVSDVSGDEDTVMLTAEYFPDEALRNAITDLYDKNLSGGLCLEEFYPAEYTDLSAMGIGCLSGIELIPSLRGLDVSMNPLFSADVSGTGVMGDDLVCTDCAVTFHDRVIYVPHDFDFSRASRWRGGVPDEENRRIFSEDGRVYYDYDCGNGAVRSFSVGTVTGDSFGEGLAWGIALAFDKDADEIALMMEEGKAPADIMAGYMRESMSDREFICRLYRCLLGRLPDREGLIYWENRLAEGVTRRFVMRGFLRSEEFSRASGDEISKDMEQKSSEETAGEVYTFFLGRSPAEWEVKLRGELPSRDAAMEIMTSDEYMASPMSDSDFAAALYMVFTEREPDKEGFAHWMDVISRDGQAAAAKGFLMSKEVDGILGT